MNDHQFLKAVQLNQTIADYLDDVVTNSTGHGLRDGALTALFGVAALFLYRLATNYLDYRRGLNEAELREVGLQQVEMLVAGGWSHAEALHAVQAIGAEVAQLRQENPIVKTAIQLWKDHARP
jgi:hypothetical protein